LLSRALVAYTIELDNLVELSLAHKTTRGGGGTRGPWLVSYAMWANCLRFLGAGPLTVAELERAARTRTNVDGMRRWGYVRTLDAAGDPVVPRSAPRGSRARREIVLTLTPSGERARTVFAEALPEIEERWRTRFSAEHVAGLRRHLMTFAASSELDLPDFLPVLGHGLWSSGSRKGEIGFAALSVEERRRRPASRELATAPLLTLLARVLLAFAIDFERHSPVSLAIASNLLGPLTEDGVRVRDLPTLTGVSREAIDIGVGALEARALASVIADPNGSRWKLAALTERGVAAKARCAKLIPATERVLAERAGTGAIEALGRALTQIGASGGGSSPLLVGLDPGPGNWRASVKPMQTLPRFPMVLHRGGYPDGS
jgi:DNA-binding MarR family transcriptional regulator